MPSATPVGPTLWVGRGRTSTDAVNAAPRAEQQMTLAQLNRCDQQRFVDALGWIFERSPWVAQRAWKARPFDDVAELHEAMVAAMLAAGRSEQLALLCAHPDLGARVRMSDASIGEQAGAGLDRLTA